MPTNTATVRAPRAIFRSKRYHRSALDGDDHAQSPSIALPSGQSPLTLQFQNWREIEANTATSCYDGGILEVSTDGTSFTQLPDAAIFAGGGYNGPVSTQFGNPLQGLQAW